MAALAGAAGRRRRAASPRRGCFGLQALGVSTVGLIPQGLPSLTLPDLALIAAAGARRARHRADELHRDDRGRPRLRAAGRSADRRQPRTGRHRRGQPRRRAVRRDAGGRRHVADGGGALGRRAIAEGLAGDRRRRAGDDAAAGAAARPAAERDAGGGRHRLLGRADPAGGVPRHPQRAHDGVPLGADRLRRRAGVRHAARASSSRSSCR